MSIQNHRQKLKTTNMKNQNKIKLFKDKKVRTLWNQGEEQWYFSIVDVIEILTESPRP
jgi:hypothetical protein